MNLEDKVVPEDNDTIFPVLPLRDVVVYPHMVIPLFVGRNKSIQALDKAMDSNKKILLVAQKSAAQDDPNIEEIYDVGTLSNILQLLKLPDGTIKVLVEGAKRAQIEKYVETEEMYSARVQILESESGDERELEVMTRSAMSQFEHYVKLNKKVPPEILSSLAGIDDSSRLAAAMRAFAILSPAIEPDVSITSDTAIGVLTCWVGTSSGTSSQIPI